MSIIEDSNNSILALLNNLEMEQDLVEEWVERAFSNDFSHMDLTGYDLSSVDFSGADLRYADLSGVYMEGADLTDAYLYGANLSGVDLSNSTLNHADDRSQSKWCRFKVIPHLCTLRIRWANVT